MYDYQLIALLLVLWTQPGDKTFLIEALNVSLEQKAGAKILEVLATTLLKV